MAAFQCRLGHTVEDANSMLRFEEWRRWAVKEALRRSKGSVTGAALRMGIGKTTLYNWLNSGIVVRNDY